MKMIQRLQLLEHLTPTEQILVDYLKENPEEFIGLKPREVSDKLFISVSTIYRLINKLGLRGVNDLKLLLRTDLQQGQNHQVSDIDFPILETDTHYEVMLRLKEVYERTIEDTLGLADPETLVSAVEKMSKANIIDIYTSSANLYFAENFQFQMQEIKQLVTVPKDDYIKSLTATNSDSSHLAFVISFGGRGSSMEAFCKILKKNQVPIILLTSTQGNPLTAYADDIIYMASSENHYNKMSSFSTRMTLLYLLDSLYSLYFQLNYDQNLAFKLEAYERMTKTKKE